MPPLTLLPDAPPTDGAAPAPPLAAVPPLPRVLVAPLPVVLGSPIFAVQPASTNKLEATRAALALTRSRGLPTLMRTIAKL